MIETHTHTQTSFVGQMFRVARTAITQTQVGRVAPLKRETERKSTEVGCFLATVGSYTSHDPADRRE